MKVTIIDSQGILSRQQKESVGLGLGWTLNSLGSQVVEATLECCLNEACDQVSCRIQVQFSDNSTAEASLQATTSEDAIRGVVGIVQKKVARHLFWSGSLSEKVVLVCRLWDSRTPEWSWQQASDFTKPHGHSLPGRETGGREIHSLFQSFLPEQQESKDHFYLNN